MDTPRWEASSSQSGFDPVGVNSVCDRPGVMLFSGLNGLSKYAHDTDLNNFGPRAGFAYRAGETLVIRADYGACTRAVPFTQCWTFSRTLDINSPDGGFTPAFILSNGHPANAVIGGWSLGVIAELRTGAPYRIIEQTNSSKAFSHGQRPNRLGDHILSGGRSKAEQLARWFDTSRFAAPGVGIFGNSPRNLCRGPGFAVVDVSIQKRFQITERTRLEFRADFFNIPNDANLNIPERRRGNSGFGRVRSTIGTGRQAQLGLRLEFQASLGRAHLGFPRRVLAAPRGGGRELHRTSAHGGIECCCDQAAVRPVPRAGSARVRRGGPDRPGRLA